jgi:hypothetical protein
MRRSPVVVLVTGLGLAACSLRLTDDDGPGSNFDGFSDEDAAPMLECALGPQYRMSHTDCGPLPPDAPPPTDCYWTIYVAPDRITYCYTDVCESLAYECGGIFVRAQSDGGYEYIGQLVDGGLGLAWIDGSTTYLFEAY